MDAWLEALISVPSRGVDLVAAALAELGCTGTIVDERPLDTFVPPDPEELAQESYGLRCFFPADRSAKQLGSDIMACLAELESWVPGLPVERPRIRSVAREDWAVNWRQGFEPLRLGRLVIQPSWEPKVTDPGTVTVELDPGMAFGTGTHPTTRLCLEILVDRLETGGLPQRVLDVGTGSGILSLAAAALGVPEVVACDIDPEACQAAAENVRRNHMEERIRLTTTPLEELHGRFGIVLANILAEENVRLARELVRHLEPGGSLVLSGILVEKEAMVEEAFDAFSWTHREVRRQGEWSCLHYRNPVR